ncbi:MAG: transcription antitermination protein NusB, partial [Chloroflexota bacterium]
MNPLQHPENHEPVPITEHPRERAARLRREARRLAMQVLFEADLTEHDALTIMFRYAADEEIELEAVEYAERLVRGVSENRETIDAIIGDAAPAFPVAQLPTVARNVLRVAVYEL